MNAILEAVKPLEEAARRIRHEMKLSGASNLVETMVSSLIDNPEELRVDVMVCGLGSNPVIRVSAAASDIGKIVGKQGRTARSIRTILSAYAKREGLTLALDIVDGASR
jgi:hypothetical protein